MSLDSAHKRLNAVLLQDLAYDITRNRAEKHVAERISLMPRCRLDVGQVYCKTVVLPQMSTELQYMIFFFFSILTAKGSVSSLGKCIII